MFPHAKKIPQRTMAHTRTDSDHTRNVRTSDVDIGFSLVAQLEELSSQCIAKSVKQALSIIFRHLELENEHQMILAEVCKRGSSSK